MKTSKWVWVSLLTGFTAIAIQCFIYLQAHNNQMGTAEVIVAVKDLKRGNEIHSGDYQVVSVQLKQASSWHPNLQRSMLKSKIAAKDIVKGSIINASDIEVLGKNKVKQAVTVKLASENAYIGLLSQGEAVNVICYYQGELKTYENLLVENIQTVGERLDGQWVYVSLSGESEALESLVKCENEGRIQIVKKISIHAS